MKNAIIIAILVAISLVSVAVAIEIGTIEVLVGTMLIASSSYVIGTNIGCE